MADSSVDIESEIDTKPAKEIPIIQDEGFFKHDTGDTYNGFFEAKKKDRSVKMHGPGTYVTAEGDIYTGNWEADRLGGSEEVTITFTDGSIYEGLFKDWCYNGPGRYIYPDTSTLNGDFLDNAPVGNLSLIDPNSHRWLGRADQGFAWLDPVNHYYDMLEKTKEVRKNKKSDLGALSAISKINSIKSVTKQ